MKIWHRLEAWLLDRKIHRQQSALAKFIRQSAYEINAWKQDIAELEEERARHLAFLQGQPSPSPGKVVPLDPLPDAFLSAGLPAQRSGVG